MENTMLNGIVFSPLAIVAFWLLTGAVLALLAIVGLLKKEKNIPQVK